MGLIAKGKTSYNFTVQNPQDAEQKIQSWLAANSFQPLQEDGQTIYRATDAFTGTRFFEYSINGAQIILYAYLGSPKKPMALADGLTGAINIIPYKNALEPLFTALNSATATNALNQPQPEQPQQPQQPAVPNQPQPQTYNDFKQANNKRNNTCAEISFWVSIVMLASSFFGIIAGAIIIIFNYYLAAQGLKSNKRGKAIAAIIISSIAIAVFIVKLIIELSK